MDSYRRGDLTFDVLDRAPTGTPAAHPVVLLHGFCLNQDSWGGQVHRLRRHWGARARIINFAQAAFGRKDVRLQEFRPPAETRIHRRKTNEEKASAELDEVLASS